MDELVDLINLLEITRKQPQYGYAIFGGDIGLGNLAEHHYLVTMIGWQISDYLNKKGAHINAHKVMQFCLTHDLGELFGGDISMYYAQANPEARKYAKQFEEENQKFLSRFFSNKEEALALTKEILDSHSDEAHIAKIADYLEVTHYKLFADPLNKKKDLALIIPKLKEKAEKVSDVIAKKELLAFIDGWEKKMAGFDTFLDATTGALGI
jgi:5'-deoxynucleotidase YfbR-like HD superfamily hydrolase